MDPSTDDVLTSAAGSDLSSLIPPEEWYEPWIRAGLYIGAAFQLVCILAVLVLPAKDDEGAEGGKKKAASWGGGESVGAAGEGHRLGDGQEVRNDRGQRREC